jgi:hypothetical protein
VLVIRRDHGFAIQHFDAELAFRHRLEKQRCAGDNVHAVDPQAGSLRAGWRLDQNAALRR